MKPHIKRVPVHRRHAAGVWSRDARAYVYPPAEHLWAVYAFRGATKPAALMRSFDTLHMARVFRPRACGHERRHA